MGLLDGKVALIFGIANHRSIGWGIAQALAREGAIIALSIFNEDLKRRVEPLAKEINCDFIELADVNNDDDLDRVYAKVAERYGKLDILVHSVAFSRKEDLGGRFIDISRDGFRLALESSAYSLISMARRAEPLMPDGGSIMSLTYYAAEKVVPDYNVMAVAKAALENITKYLAADMGHKKIRVNTISAGPIKTLAAAGIPGFKSLIRFFDEASPLPDDLTIEDVGNTAVFLASDLSKSMTGELLHVDRGYNVLGFTVPKEIVESRDK